MDRQRYKRNVELFENDLALSPEDRKSETGTCGLCKEQAVEIVGVVIVREEDLADWDLNVCKKCYGGLPSP